MSYPLLSVCVPSKDSTVVTPDNPKIITHNEKTALITDFVLALFLITAGGLIVLQSRGKIDLRQFSGLGSIGTKGGFAIAGIGGAIGAIDLTKLHLTQRRRFNYLADGLRITPEDVQRVTQGAYEGSTLPAQFAAINQQLELDATIISQLKEENNRLKEQLKNAPTPKQLGNIEEAIVTLEQQLEEVNRERDDLLKQNGRLQTKLEQSSKGKEVETEGEERVGEVETLTEKVRSLEEELKTLRELKLETFSVPTTKEEQQDPQTRKRVEALQKSLQAIKNKTFQEAKAEAKREHAQEIAKLKTLLEEKKREHESFIESHQKLDLEATNAQNKLEENNRKLTREVKDQKEAIKQLQTQLEEQTGRHEEEMRLLTTQLKELQKQIREEAEKAQLHGKTIDAAAEGQPTTPPSTQPKPTTMTTTTNGPTPKPKEGGQ